MKRIYNILSVAAVALVLFSCGPKGEQVEVDNSLLVRARAEYENGNYNNARKLIDSIKIVSPKAYKLLHEAEVLRHEVLIKEQERNVAFYEEEVRNLEAARKSLASNLVYNKKGKYYTVKSQDVSKNSNNNFLRASVYDDGTMYLTSFYRGKKKLNYRKLKLSSNGTYASCDKVVEPIRYDSRNYKYGNDDGLIDFINGAKGRIEVELSNDKDRVAYILRDSDVEAVREILQLRHAIVAVREAEGELKKSKYMLGCLKGSASSSTEE